MSQNRDQVLVSSNSEGLSKVLSDMGSYAFFMESTSIEYLTERHCQLQKVGGNLDAKSYGIALPQGKCKGWLSQNAFL